MDPQPTAERGRVIGLGGVFFKSADPSRLSSWYRENLGLAEGAGGCDFKWRRHDRPDIEQLTVWCAFPANTKYFDPSPAPFMLNYIVDDLDAILAKLERTGVRIDPKREDYDYGRFGWIFDPDGNKIELWEPRS